MFKRQLTLLGHLWFLLFFAISIIFYQERVLFVDSAYQFFKIVNFEGFNLEASRYSTYITQILPVILVKLGLPLKQLMISYSISFILTYYIVFLLCVYCFRNIAAGIAIILVLTLNIRHNFFFIVHETHQALIYSCLFWAWLHSYSRSRPSVKIFKFFNFLLGIGIALLCFYAHPVGLFSLIFVILYNIIDTGQYRELQSYFILFGIIGISIAKVQLTSTSSYEGEFFSQISQFPEMVKNYANLTANIFYRQHYRELYHLSILLLVATCVYYLSQRNFSKLIFLIVYYFGFLTFATLMYSNNAGRHMLERGLMPLALFIGIPFTNDVLIKPWLKKLKFILIIIYAVFYTDRIYDTSKIFTARVDYMETFIKNLQSKDIHKAVIRLSNTQPKLLHTSWGWSIETLIYSTANYGESRTVYLDPELKYLDNYIDKEYVFLCTHFDMIWHIDRLNPDYFKLPWGKYTVLKEKILYKDSSIGF